MTELLYLKDSYIRDFEAKVVGVRDYGVILDRTAFYPGGGGQPPDKGVLIKAGQEYGIVSFKREGDDIIHVLDREPPDLESKVRGIIDWELRYGHMRHHTAVHIIAAAAYRLFGSLVTGSQIYHDRARVDLDIDELGPDKVKILEQEANKATSSSLKVSYKFVSRDHALSIPGVVKTKGVTVPEDVSIVRLVEIEGFDVQADGGTHVANTKEIGTIKIVKTLSKGKHNKRLEIVLKR